MIFSKKIISIGGIYIKNEVYHSKKAVILSENAPPERF